MSAIAPQHILFSQRRCLYDGADLTQGPAKAFSVLRSPPYQRQIFRYKAGFSSIWALFSPCGSLNPKFFKTYWPQSAYRGKEQLVEKGYLSLTDPPKRVPHHYETSNLKAALPAQNRHSLRLIPPASIKTVANTPKIMVSRDISAEPPP